MQNKWPSAVAQKSNFYAVIKTSNEVEQQWNQPSTTGPPTTLSVHRVLCNEVNLGVLRDSYCAKHIHHTWKIAMKFNS